MKLNPIRQNVTEITTNDGTVILFSYHTAVAACLGNGGGFIRTNRKWSKTTSKHISQWLNGAKAREVSQEEMDRLGSRETPSGLSMQALP